MERSKEEYELLLKKDKDLDRQFKKEFHGYDFYYDSLLKLFKKRESVSSHYHFALISAFHPKKYIYI